MEAKDKIVPEMKTKFQGDQGGINLKENCNKNIEEREQNNQENKNKTYIHTYIYKRDQRESG